jgi:hypothetical protein
LCMTTRLTEAGGCSGPTSFDAIDSHPYGIYGPNWHAYLADDVSVPDVYKLVNVLHAAEKIGTAVPRGAKGNWVTETSWDTDPPDPDGVPINEQALWLEQALYNLWKQGVSTVLWWQIEDSPPVPSYLPSRHVLPGRPSEAQRNIVPIPVHHLAQQLRNCDCVEHGAPCGHRFDPGEEGLRMAHDREGPRKGARGVRNAFDLDTPTNAARKTKWAYIPSLEPGWLTTSGARIRFGSFKQRAQSSERS